MRLPKAFWEVLALAAFGLALAGGAVLLVRSTARPRPREEPPLSPPDAGMPAALSSALSEIRQRSLELSAPTWRSQRLAVSGGRLVRLGDAEWSSLSLTTLEEKHSPLAGPRAVVALPGGSLVIVAERETLELEPGAAEPSRLPRVAFLPGSELVPERRDPRKLWILNRPTRSLVRYELVRSELPLLPIDRTLELSEGASGAFASVRDGSWAYVSGAALEVRLPEGKPRRFELEGKLPWRLLPGTRVDDLWAVTESGEVTLFRVLDRPRKVTGFRSLDAPLDAAASERHFALLVVREGGPRREFRLQVWDLTGKLELETSLGSDDARPDEDWAALALRREVALSDAPPRVAVLDPSGLRVWDLATAALVHGAAR